MSEHVVELLLVPMRNAKRDNDTCPGQRSDMFPRDPLAPVLPVNTATLAGQVSVRKPRPRVGAVLRSCEMRALVELVKFQQASLEDMVLIAVDCAGTYGVPEYLELPTSNGKQKDDLWKNLYMAAIQNPEVKTRSFTAGVSNMHCSRFLTRRKLLSNY